MSSNDSKGKGKDKGRFQIRILDNTNIQSEECHLITLDVEASDTIAIVKTKFYLKTNTDPEEGEQLYFGLQLLVNDHTLSDYNIQQGYTLLAVSKEGVTDNLYFCMEGQPEMTNVGEKQYLKTSSGWLHLSAWTVENLKDMISYESKEHSLDSWNLWQDYNLDELQFYFGNQLLEGDHTLSDYNIQPGHVIVCKPKDKGKGKGKSKTTDSD